MGEVVAGGKEEVEAAKDAERSSGGGEGRESCRRCASSRRSARDCLDSRGCGEKGGERAVRRRATDEFSRRGLRRRWVRSAKRTLADKPKWRGDESENTVRSAGQASTRRVRATASESFRLALTLASRTKGRSTARISPSRGCELHSAQRLSPPPFLRRQPRSCRLERRARCSCTLEPCGAAPAPDCLCQICSKRALEAGVLAGLPVRGAFDLRRGPCERVRSCGLGQPPNEPIAATSVEK